MFNSIKQSFLKHKTIFIAEIAAFLILGTTFLIAQSQTPKTATEGVNAYKPVIKPKVTPTPVPLTAQNVDKAIEENDFNIQSVLSQMESDLNSINKIDANQDSTIGL